MMLENKAEALQEAISIVLKQLIHYVSESQKGAVPVLRQMPVSELGDLLQLEKWIRQGGMSPNELSSFLKVYLANTQHMHHPHFIGHQVAAPHVTASGIADLIHGVINNPMAIYEMGPAAATIEGAVINWMLSKVGWFRGATLTDFAERSDSGAGILTHGGSLANMTALLAARAKVAPEAWEHGTPDDLVILGSEVAHYSMARSVSIIGLGKKALLPVATDPWEVLLPDALYKTYQEVRAEGKRVMCVTANACATSTGLYDPILEMADLCEEEGLWLHVDGAHGGSALLVEEERHLLDGVVRADSMIWDAHKMMRTSALCAAVLFRKSEDMAATFQQKGSYIFHDKEQPGFDLMPYALECTKAGIGTKLFWVLATEGEDSLAQFVKDRYAITKDFYNYINAQPDFTCPYPPESNILCFQYKGDGATDDLQLDIRNQLVSDGDFYITSAEVSGRRYLRISVMNEFTQLKHIEDMLDRIREVGEALMG